MRASSTRRRARWRVLGLDALWVLSALSTSAALPTTSVTAATESVVYTAEVDSMIHPASAQFMRDTMNQADRAGARLLVFTLRTPGGLVDSTREIVTQMIAAKTPVAIYVGPAGARAASAGFILTIAADIAAMAPGTHIGAAHPVDGGGEPTDPTRAKKATEDVAAYARTLAGSRHRNVDLAAQAVNESRAFTEAEALSASPPLIDLVASDLPDLLRKLDGRTITRFDGATVMLNLSGARSVAIEMSLRQRVLGAIAHPNIAYLLLTLGTLGLTIEMWSPGAVLPGVAGAVCLLLAFFALSVLPVNYAGLLLVLCGLIFLVLEIKVTSYGLLTAAGLVSLAFGSMMMMDSSSPELRVSLSVVLPVVVGLAGIGIFLARLGVAAQRRQPVTGAAGMIGELGEALTSIEPGGPGRVTTHGEIWRAKSSEPIAAGARVRVTGIEGLMLTVKKE
jgi:membrane-bound serine protease (ClpP class)